jgi:hypothetical protein
MTERGARCLADALCFGFVNQAAKRIQFVTTANLLVKGNRPISELCCDFTGMRATVEARYCAWQTHRADGIHEALGRCGRVLMAASCRLGAATESANELGQDWYPADQMKSPPADIGGGTIFSVMKKHHNR